VTSWCQLPSTSICNVFQLKENLTSSRVLDRHYNAWEFLFALHFYQHSTAHSLLWKFYNNESTGCILLVEIFLHVVFITSKTAKDFLTFALAPYLTQIEAQ
jgi:hypothetical protein